MHLKGRFEGTSLKQEFDKRIINEEKVRSSLKS